MSKNLPAEFAFEKDRLDARPFNTAVFHFPMPVGDIYVSDREVTIGGNVHAGVVSRWGEYRSIVAPRDGLFRLGAMGMELINFPTFGSPAKRFTDLWTGLGVEGIEVDVYQCLRQHSQDAVLQHLLFSGVMRPLSYRPNLCSLDIYSVSEKYLDRRECSQPIDQLRYPNADPDDIGKRENVVFGTVKKARAHLVYTGQKSTVRATMTTAATTVPIQDDFYEYLNVNGISSGTVQAGNEKIAWTSRSGSAGAYVLGNLTRGSGSTPIEQHNPNDTLLEVVSSWIYEAAGHVMKSVDRVYVRRGDKLIPLAAAQYTINLNNTTLVAGESKTTITFTTPPLVAEKDHVALSAGSGEAQWEQAGSDQTLVIQTYANGLGVGQWSNSTAIAFPAQEKTKISGSFKKRFAFNYISGARTGFDVYVTTAFGAVGVLKLIQGSANVAPTPVQIVEANDFWDLHLIWKNESGSDPGNLQQITVGVSALTCSYAIAGATATLTATSTADNPIGEVYFDGQGYADDGSGTYTGVAAALVEKPADVMHYYARVVLGIPANRVDAAAFVQARADSPASYKFAAVLGERSNAKEILLAMGAQSALQPDWPADKLTVRKLKPLYGAPAKILTQDRIIAGTLAVERGAVDELLNVVDVYSGLDRSQPRGRKAFTKVAKTDVSAAPAAASIAKYGRREQADRFLCDYIGADNDAMAADLRNFYLGRMTEPPRLISLEAKLDQYELANGDLIGLDFKTRLDYPQQNFDGLDGAQSFLVEQASLRPGSARGGQATRVGLRLREVPALSLAKIPNELRPSLLFYAPLRADLNFYSKLSLPGLTFVRASAATYVNPASGLIASAASGVARFESAGMVFEGAATNLLLRSSELENAAWQRVGLSAVNANAVAGPSGVSDFETVVEDTSTGNHLLLSFSSTFTAGSKLTFSVDLKAGARSWAILQLIDAGGVNNNFVFFDLATGTVGSVTIIGAATSVTYGIEPAPNGYYRCRLSLIIDGSSTSARVALLLSTGDTVTTYAGNGSGSIHAGNAQLEIAAQASSRIATVAATVTRAADDLRITESGHLAPAAGTIIFIADVKVVDTAADAYQLIDAVAAGGATGVEITIDANAVRARVYSGGATVANLTGGGTFTAGVAKKIGLAWQANDFRLVIDGVQVASDSAGAAPTALHGTSIFTAQRADGSRRLIGHMGEVATYDRALSNGEIALAMAAL